MKAERIKNQTIEIDGLWRRGVFQKVLRSSITPQDRVFTSRFHTRLNEKGVNLTSVKYASLCKGNTCVEKMMTVSAITPTLSSLKTFSPVPAASGFRTIFILATQQNMFAVHIDISQAFVSGKVIARRRP